MKTFLALCLLFAAPLALPVWAAGAPATAAATSSAITGEVLEVKDVDNYTYLRLKTKEGETWAAVGTAPIKVAKASGANARTVAEVTTKSAELKDKPVVVSGKVVKYNPAIMGKNWIHLRDGSGDAAKETNDILVTTAAQTKVGDVVTVSGIVRTNKDFGSGYTYKVLIEDATLKP
jgi:hypothetical protein